MPHSATTSFNIRHQIATALCFFSLGFGTAAWAPLIPLAQTRLSLSHADFGMLLLCAGVGSMLAMPLAARAAQHWGCRGVLAMVLLVLMLILPALAYSPTVWMMAVSLFCFGASAGALGVSVNLQATLLEQQQQRSLMSLFHGVCSLGGLVGVLGMTSVLSLGVASLAAAFGVSLIMLLLALFALPYCLKSQNTGDQPNKAGVAKRAPTWGVLGIGMICFIAFLSEGAAMDWSGIYLHQQFNVALQHAGLAYSVFAALMVVGRFSGHWISNSYGAKRTVLISSLLAALGLFTVVLAPIWQVVLLGYALLGLGSANIVPLMFSRAAQQTQLPSHVALSYVSMLAYTGSLMGPALVGFAGQQFGLMWVFSAIAAALLMIAILNHYTALDETNLDDPLIDAAVSNS